jgi:hypothetical protein
MSIHDETWDRPICDFCGKEIPYGEKLSHRRKECLNTSKINTEPELKTLVKRFFEILDQKEESDSGREFSPVFISCCRARLNEELGKILPKMKKLSND